MVNFGGWSMPLQYSSIVEEHLAVRSSLGVFDISHMGELLVSGPDASVWLNRMLTNNIERLGIGEGQYTFLLNEAGGVIDDLIVYRIADTTFLMVVNAAMIDVDFGWLQSRQSGDMTIANESQAFAGFAVQGPRSAKLFDRFFGEKHSRPSRNEILQINVLEETFHIARTGYTGEDGFEIFCPALVAIKVWNEILKRGADFDIKPCGLGARDTLRLEMCYPLNGFDLCPERTPLEAGLSIFVDFTKQDFIGRDALLKQRESGILERLVPFKMDTQCPPPRAHYPLFKGERQVGEVSSGTLSPTLKACIGMAYLPMELARINERIEVDIRGRRYPATVQKKPLHKKQ